MEAGKILGPIVGLLCAIGCWSPVQGQDKRASNEGSIGPEIPMWTNVRSVLPDDDWRHIASRYSIVFTLFSPTAAGKDLTGENERVKWIKSLNPDLKVLVYGSAINASNFRLHTWRQPREHADWFLKDEAGEWVVDHEYGGALHLDPGNKEWQQYVGNALKEYIERYGYDGVFLDLVVATTKYVNFKKPRKTVNPRTGKPYTDDDWKEANLELLRIVRGYIGDKLLIINGCQRGKGYFRHGYSDFLAVADGICNEGFTGWRQTPSGPFAREEDWKADVDALVDCARRGKVVLAVANCKKRGDEESPEAYDRLYRYIAASFLLGMDSGQYLMFYAKTMGRPENYRPDEEVLPAFCNVSLGKPLREYSKVNGVYQREFERGKVLVNPTRRKTAVKLAGAWKTSEGKSVVSPLVMPPHTGILLLRDEAQ